MIGKDDLEKLEEELDEKEFLDAIEDLSFMKVLHDEISSIVKMSKEYDFEPPIKLFVLLQPYTGREERAFHLAAAVARMLREMFPEIPVFSPIMHTHTYSFFYDGEIPAEEFYKWDLLLYENFPKETTLFILFPGWRESSGCLKELEFLTKENYRTVSFEVYTNYDF